MNATGSLFSQILSLFQRSDFARHARDLKADFRAKGFSSWDQFVAMLFCQLGQAWSLREITDGLLSCEGKLKHLGLMGHPPRRSTLSYANAHRPWQLYQRLFYDLLGQRIEMQGLTGHRSMMQGVASLPIPQVGLATGIYILTVTIDGDRQVYRVKE